MITGATPSERIPVEAIGVAKSFGEFAALRDLSMEVHSGQCVGLLGPNGAGKSTFIGCLYGVVKRSAGELRVFGFDPARDARRIKERIGVVPQENALDEELTVLENMRLYARFEGVKHPVPRIEELLAQLSLDHKRDAPIRSLSGGMKRRLTFVRALLADPELLILDEPTTGLDPTVRHLLWDKVLSYRQAGKTVLLTTHYMHEAELLCDGIVILNHGAVVAMGSPKELIDSETPGFVAIFEADQQARLQAHLDPGWQSFNQARQYCVRAPKVDYLIRLQDSSGVKALWVAGQPPRLMAPVPRRPTTANRQARTPGSVPGGFF